MNRQYRNLWANLSYTLREIGETARQLGVSPSTQLQQRLHDLGMEVSLEGAKTIIYGLMYMNVDKDASAFLIEAIVTELERIVAGSNPDATLETLVGNIDEQFQSKSAEIFVSAVTRDWQKVTSKLALEAKEDPIFFAEFVQSFWASIG